MLRKEFRTSDRAMPNVKNVNARESGRINRKHTVKTHFAEAGDIYLVGVKNIVELVQSAKYLSSTYAQRRIGL